MFRFKANFGNEFLLIVWTRLSIVKKSDCAAVLGIQAQTVLVNFHKWLGKDRNSPISTPALVHATFDTYHLFYLIMIVVMIDNIMVRKSTFVQVKKEMFEIWFVVDWIYFCSSYSLTPIYSNAARYNQTEPICSLHRAIINLNHPTTELCKVWRRWSVITATTKLDLKLDFSPSPMAVVHSSQSNERSGDMSHIYDHFIFQEC